jgi:lipopolysaccharide/colanic/teichoic acid biosynthesis glycosyltransferase
MVRFFDIFFVLLSFVVVIPVGIIILIIGFFDSGSPLFIQERMGKNKKMFKLVKFRTMKRGTASVSTHLANANAITRWGSFLRRSKLDELPQLWNVLIGQMSIVGPRPNLANQKELIIERESRGVYRVRPGITGLSQTLKIDMSTPELLAITDAKMIENESLYYYFKYIFLTIIGKGGGDRIVK